MPGSGSGVRSQDLRVPEPHVCGECGGLGDRSREVFAPDPAPEWESLLGRLERVEMFTTCHPLVNVLWPFVLKFGD